MKKISLLVLTLLIFVVWFLSSNVSPILAQDAPNINVTKRRPDQPAGYSSSPSPTIQSVDVKQLETKKPSFFAKVWTWLKALFTN